MAEPPGKSRPSQEPKLDSAELSGPGEGGSPCSLLCGDLPLQAMSYWMVGVEGSGCMDAVRCRPLTSSAMCDLPDSNTLSMSYIGVSAGRWGSSRMLRLLTGSWSAGFTSSISLIMMTPTMSLRFLSLYTGMRECPLMRMASMVRSSSRSSLDSMNTLSSGVMDLEAVLDVRSSAPRMTNTSASVSEPPNPAVLPCTSTSAMSWWRRNSSEWLDPRTKSNSLPTGHATGAHSSMSSRTNQANWAPTSRP
mmetsp:Transcript_20191/g.56246  ORF Transcript_20191/g.56246 Transcript_20191/m.56246 type:complete len:249 (-) Transcript_20191:535-1281(-)